MARHLFAAAILLGVLLCVQWADSTARHCPPCNKYKCASLWTEDCAYGIGKDICNCCDVCLQGPGQSCGGFVNKKCGKGLKCVGRPGKCIKPHRPSSRCPPCYKEDCETLWPEDCLYGVGKDSCKCCDVCLQGPGQTCGGPKHSKKCGKCGKGLKCVGATRYRPGKCAKPHGSCPCKRKCRRVRCNTKQYCKYGRKKPKCGCCSVCRAKCDQKCGAGIAVCRKGHYCKGGKVSKDYHGYCKFTPGWCKKRYCPCNKKRCRTVRCGRPHGCKYGYATSKCSCCASCRVGAGKRCTSDVNCRKGYKCQINKIWWYDAGRKCYRKRGICVKSFSSCPCKRHCRDVRCHKPRHCKYGYEKPKCGCCLVCRAACDKKCGAGIAVCRKGHYCKGDKVSKDYYGYCKFTPGWCKKTYCPCSRKYCRKVHCKKLYGCKYGYAKPKCGCCAVCKKRKGQRCGDRDGVCRRGLKCKLNKIWYYDLPRKCYRKQGRCVGSFSSCPCKRDCRDVHCRKPRHCKYGYKKPKCGCCLVCRAACDKKCGAGIAVCRKGHYCKGDKVSKDYYGYCKFTPGWCKKTYCPCNKKYCKNVRCKKPYGCRYGYKTPKCGCCPVCKKRKGERCGDRDGVCRKGLKCKISKLWYYYLVHKCYHRRGRCVKRSCPCKRSCRGVRCHKPRYCKYGYAKPKCGCCLVCRVACDKKCGAGQAVCRHGHYCKGEKIRSDHYGYCRFTPGWCKKRYCPCHKKHCRNKRCKKPYGCKYGHAKPKCGCCRVCRRESGQRCGDRDGVCRKGYKCKTSKIWYYDKSRKCYRRRGTCVKRSCPCQRRCKRVRCIKPIYCKYGYAKPKCGCCLVCRAGYGKRCGKGLAACQRGCYCKGEKVGTDYHGFCKFTPGWCKKRYCRCKPKCNRALCKKPYGCRYGSARPKCGCCPVCRKGRGKRCGDRDGVCRKGYKCKINKIWYYDGRRRCYRRRGYCVKRSCPCRRRCRGVRCHKPRYCKYGYAKPKCGCCLVCRAACKKRCGKGLAVCQRGCECKGEKIKTDRYGYCRFTPGWCKKRYCPCHKKYCKKVRCKKLYGCKYGYATPKCGCCPVCKKVIGETCGDRDGVCQKGYDCKISNIWYYDGGRTCYRKRGTCVKRYCTCKKYCAGVYCKKPYGCKYGSAKPKCGCCPVCKKGGKQVCGDHDGVCRKGYKCTLTKIWYYDGGLKCYRRRGTCCGIYGHGGSSHKHGGYSSYDSGDYSSESKDYSSESKDYSSGSKDYSSGSKDYSYDDEDYSSLEGGGSSYVDHKKTYKKVGSIYEHSKHLSEEKKGYSAKEEKSEVKHGDGGYSAHEQSSSSSYNNKKSESYKTKSVSYDYETLPYNPFKGDKEW